MHRASAPFVVWSASVLRSRLLVLPTYLGATAGGAHPSVRAAAASMTSIGASVTPDGRGDVVEYHRRKYEVFRKMNDDQIAYRRMMSE